jgi:hypothetical protein
MLLLLWLKNQLWKEIAKRPALFPVMVHFKVTRMGRSPGNKISFGVARYPFNYNPLRQRRCRIPPNDIGSFGYWAATSVGG